MSWWRKLYYKTDGREGDLIWRENTYTPHPLTLMNLLAVGASS